MTTGRHSRLRRRAELRSRLRAFFDNRGFLEVETPLLNDEIIPELHIEPFAVAVDPATSGQPPAAPSQKLWLQASPEMHMKRLVAEGLPALFQVTRSFRRDERGNLHNPEFTIVEWYRRGDSMVQGIDLLDALCQEVAGFPPAIRTSYADAYTRHAGVDAHRATCTQLAAAAERLGIDVPVGLKHDDRDEWLNLLMATQIEPRLGESAPEIIFDYPASQASLAHTTVRATGDEVAERFELYWRGIELANGFHELTDAAALRRRLEQVNLARAAENHPVLPLPERLLAAMDSPGLPACTGCALGFDRFAMLAVGASTIHDVLTFPWSNGESV